MKRMPPGEEHPVPRARATRTHILCLFYMGHVFYGREGGGERRGRGGSDAGGSPEGSQGKGLAWREVEEADPGGRWGGLRGGKRRRRRPLHSPPRDSPVKRKGSQEGAPRAAAGAPEPSSSSSPSSPAPAGRPPVSRPEGTGSTAPLSSPQRRSTAGGDGGGGWREDRPAPF